MLGITGTGGAGKSSLTDELVRRFRLDQDDRAAASRSSSIDPSRRKSGGALLGDRIRMNAIEHPNIYMRSLATRDAGSEISQGAARRRSPRARSPGFDLIIVETSGIGQGDAAIVPLVDVVAVRDDARVRRRVASSRRSTCSTSPTSSRSTSSTARAPQDALRDVRKQFQRNRELFKTSPDEMPVFGTIAARFNDDGVTALYQALRRGAGRRRA